MTKISTDPPAFRVRPAQPEEAGVFFAQTSEQDALMGGIGHVRMDFGGSGKEFWHTWHPRGAESLNTPEFKAELQQVVDKLRETVLKDLSSMRRFCYENGGKIPGGWSQNYGYVVETEHYEYCLRCNPVPGDYQAYLSCYDLNEQKINHAYRAGCPVCRIRAGMEGGIIYDENSEARKAARFLRTALPAVCNGCFGGRKRRCGICC